MRGVARRVVRTLIVGLVLLVGAVVLAAFVIQTAWFKARLRDYVVDQANQYLTGAVTIDRLDGNLLSGVELEGLSVSLEGQTVLAARDVGLSYSLMDLVTRGLWIRELRVNQPRVRVAFRDGGWDISRLIRREEQEADRTGPASPAAIEVIAITDGLLEVAGADHRSSLDLPDRIEHFDARLAFHYEPVRYTIDVAHVSFTSSRYGRAGIGLQALSGTASVRDGSLFLEDVAVRTDETSIFVDGAVRNYLTTPVLNLNASSDSVSLPEIARLIKNLEGIALRPAFELSADGPLDRLDVRIDIRSDHGQLAGRVRADTQAPRLAVQGDVTVRRLNLAPLVTDPKWKSDLTADVALDVEADTIEALDKAAGSVSVTGTRLAAAGHVLEHVDVRARLAGKRAAVEARATAYGTRIESRGRIALSTAAVSYDLRGVIRGLDLRRLPPALEIPPADTDIAAAYHVRGTEPIRGRAGGPAPPRRSNADLVFEASTVAGARLLDGSTAGLTLGGGVVTHALDVTVSDLDLQRIGRVFDIPALDRALYATRLNGRVSSEGVGTSPSELDIAARGRLSPSAVAFAVIPDLTFDGTYAHDHLHVIANGGFSDLDPTRIGARPSLAGRLAGRFDVDVNLDGVSSGVDPERVSGLIQARLAPSTIAGVSIDNAVLDGSYRDSTAHITGLNLSGPALSATATGQLALNDTGRSNLTFKADSTDLAALGRVFDVPLDGIGRVDGTVTGNRSALEVSGSMSGDGLRYEEHGALDTSSAYVVRIPDFDFERATADASVRASFVTIAEQHISEVSGTAHYGDRRLAFDATAVQEGRRLTTAGALDLHPDHQELHVHRLSLNANGLDWQLAAGTESTIHYGGELVTVRGLRLASGEQEIAAEGAFGQPGSTLNVTLTEIDLSSVDQLLLRPPQFSGRMNATAVVSGTTASPEVRGEFSVRPGGFRKFTYESFAGSIEYGAGGVALDARLQQNESQWLTVKGQLPARRGGKLDLTLDSTPIDLGLVQGFTTVATDVRGTLEAHVRLTGTTDDPFAEGNFAISGAGLSIKPLGVAYSNIGGRIDLHGDRLHIEQLTVLDNHFSALTVTGDLAINRQRTGNVQLYLTADDFKILDNQLGNVRIQARLEVDGEVAAPRVRGYLGSTTGQVNLDEVMAFMGVSAYPVAETGSQPGSDEPGILDALTVNLDVGVPPAFIVRANDLRAPGGPLSLGRMQVTLGGNLEVSKAAGNPVRLVGTVNTVRGGYEFQGRPFEIMRDGSIRFEGLDELNPSLDLRARRMIRGVEARVNIRGTMKQPEIVLSSVPPQEQADILSLIVFNQPVNELGQGEQATLAAHAQNLAAGKVAGQLAQSIGRALHLDTFAIQLAPDTGGAAAITVGQQIGRDLYLRLQQGLGNASSSTLILEYELARWLRLQTNFTQGPPANPSMFIQQQGSGADLYFFFSY
jgi:autotransporter translocation and assembly factor TamB